VFQRKWQTLAQYQQTRGTLAMLAQWISWAYREGFTRRAQNRFSPWGLRRSRFQSFGPSCSVNLASQD
jgi:hypothetical protein